MTDLHCTKCGESFLQSLLAAFVIETGGSASWDPRCCPDGTPHDFQPVQRQKQESGPEGEEEARCGI